MGKEDFLYIIYAIIHEWISYVVCQQIVSLPEINRRSHKEVSTENQLSGKRLTVVY